MNPNEFILDLHQAIITTQLSFTCFVKHSPREIKPSLETLPAVQCQCFQDVNPNACLVLNSKLHCIEPSWGTVVPNPISVLVGWTKDLWLALIGPKQVINLRNRRTRINTLDTMDIGQLLCSFRSCINNNNNICTKTQTFYTDGIH